jgi:putative iron-dependent peroxidase
VISVKLAGATSVVDETSGFAYMDSRDLIGFVDGTENPDADERAQFVIVGDEDPQHAGGSYVTTQRYVTDFARWNACSTEDQEAAVGRTKGRRHRARRCDVSAERTQGAERRSRATAPSRRSCARTGPGERPRSRAPISFAYARDLSVTEEMLERMFVADAEGVYDRLVDFSTPVTGTNFFAPSLDVLESLADAPSPARQTEGTLGIGDLARSARCSDAESGRRPSADGVAVALISAPPVAREAQQHQEEVDEVQVERQRADDPVRADLAAGQRQWPSASGAARPRPSAP